MPYSTLACFEILVKSISGSCSILALFGVQKEKPRDFKWECSVSKLVCPVVFFLSPLHQELLCCFSIVKKNQVQAKSWQLLRGALSLKRMRIMGVGTVCCVAVKGKGCGGSCTGYRLTPISPFALPEILTLDASSAHPGLVVAPDRRSVRHGKKVLCSQPRDPQRFFPAFCILGSEGFSSGQHIWEVRVEGKDGWAVGVAKESVRRQGPMGLLPQNGVWAVELGRYKLLPFGPARPQEGPECRLSRIQVCLDYEEGRVTFANSEDQALLFTFRASFTERIFPFFWLWSHHAQITLCP